MKRAGVVALFAAAFAVLAWSCIDLEGAYQNCIDSGRCGDAQDAGHDAGGGGGGNEDSGTDAGVDAGTQDAGSDAGTVQRCLCPPRKLCKVTGTGILSGTDLQAVHVAAPADVWIAGAGWTTVHRTNGQWVTETPGGVNGTDLAIAVSGTSPEDVWEFGSSIYARQWNGTDWTEHPATGFSQGAFIGYAGIPGLPLSYSVSDGQTRVIMGFDGGWYPETNGLNTPVYGLCGVAPDAAWAVGPFETLRSRSASGQWTLRSCATNCVHDYYDCWSDGNETLLAGTLSSGGSAVSLLTDAGQVVDVAPQPNTGRLFGVWGSGRGDAWAVGTEGTILRRTNSAWERVDAGLPGITFYDVAGIATDGGEYEVWIVGSSSTVLQYCE